MRITLRPYQEDCLRRIGEAEARGVRAQLVVAATGSGKTVLFTALAERRGGRALILAHRDELISQAVEKVREVCGHDDIGVIKGPRNELHAKVVVASIQTLSRPNRLAALQESQRDAMIKSEPFNLVVYDESHHATSPSGLAVINGLEAGTPSGPLLLGVTATPDRADGKGLDTVFEEIVFEFSILDAIRQGFLCDIVAMSVRVDALDLSGVKLKRGDYDAGQIGRALTDAHAEVSVVDAWQEHASDRRSTLVFTPTVATAEAVAGEFVSRGVPAAFASAKTPPEERRYLVEQFSNGALKVLCNCGLFTEGTDIPAVDAVVLARPTKSRGLFTQMVGRGMRLYPGKSDLLVLDITGNSDRLSLVTVPSLFGVEVEADKRRPGAPVSIADLVMEHDAEEVRAGRLRAEQAELFRQVHSEGVAWVPVEHESGRSRFVRQVKLASGWASVVLAQQASGGWTAGVRLADGSKRVLMHDVRLELAQGIGEDFLRKHTHKSTVSADAPWRVRQPTERQLDAAKKWRLVVDPEWTAGELSDQLTAHIEHVKSNRWGDPR